MTMDDQNNGGVAIDHPYSCLKSEPEPIPLLTDHRMADENKKKNKKKNVYYYLSEAVDFCRIGLMMLSFCIFLALVFFILFLVPGFVFPTNKLDIINLSPPVAPIFQVDSVILYPFDISNSHITANWKADFSIGQFFVPVSYYQYLEGLEASVFYNNTFMISSTPFVGSKFFLEGNTLMHNVDLVASSVYLNQTLADAILSERYARGALTFAFKLKASLVEYTDAGKEEYPKDYPSYHAEIWCKDLTLAFISDSAVATLLGAPIKCSAAII